MKYVLSIATFVLCTISIAAQHTLTGIITNAENNEALEQVSIYFPQLEKGTVSDIDGNYEIKNLPKGNFKIIISFLGFQTFSKTIDIDAANTDLSVSLIPSAIEMEEVIVSTPFHKLQRENVMKVERASVQELRSKGAITLSDGITNIPGVESVSTGVGIGKPVIRGLSSNRVLTYTQGIRLENQQFGDEHGLGISDSGIESVEVIKGPASLLYGSDALGGVLYLNPERFAIPNETEGDVKFNYFTNTQGLNGNAGFKTTSDRLKFLIRGSAASHVDYENGAGVRVTNSRFKEYDLKTGLGYQHENFNTELRYNYNDSELGIPEEIGVQNTNRTAGEPFQEITGHILSSKSNFYLKKSSLQAIFGFTQNNRKEFEEHEEEGAAGEEGPALDMKLHTFSYNLQYNLPKMGGLETILGVQGMNQKNQNFGEEVLIPDATTKDIGILANSHLHFSNDSDLQLGVRYDNRNINSDENVTDGEEGYIAPLERNFNSFNLAVGYKISLLKELTARINLASGFRAPNLAELTSNGVHEGTNRFEIGNPDLKNEQNFQTDLSLEFKNEHLEILVNGFYNAVSDYIYLEPNGEFMGSDAVFPYLQQDADLYGGEIGLHYHPHPLDRLHLESNFASVRGKRDNRENLPLIPANNWTNTLRFEFNDTKKVIRNSYGSVSLRSFFQQNKVSAFETVTPAYSLLNIGIGTTIIWSGQEIGFRLSANNLFDKNYVSHLSRLKPDGISNIGRNINLGISIPL